MSPGVITVILLPRTGVCRSDCTGPTWRRGWPATMWTPGGPCSASGGHWTALLLASLKPGASTTSSCSSRKTTGWWWWWGGEQTHTGWFSTSHIRLCDGELVCVCSHLHVQHFIPVFQKVHEQDPQLLGAGAEVVMAAQGLGRPHLQTDRVPWI